MYVSIVCYYCTYCPSPSNFPNQHYNLQLTSMATAAFTSHLEIINKDIWKWEAQYLPKCSSRYKKVIFPTYNWHSIVLLWRFSNRKWGRICLLIHVFVFFGLIVYVYYKVWIGVFRFRISCFMETFLLSVWKIQKKEKKSNASICFSVSSDRLQYKERSRSGSENALLTPMSSWLAHRGKWKLRDFPYLSFSQARYNWQSFAIISNHLQSS